MIFSILPVYDDWRQNYGYKQFKNQTYSQHEQLNQFKMRLRCHESIAIRCSRLLLHVGERLFRQSPTCAWAIKTQHICLFLSFTSMPVLAKNRAPLVELLLVVIFKTFFCSLIYQFTNAKFIFDTHAAATQCTLRSKLCTLRQLSNQVNCDSGGNLLVLVTMSFFIEISVYLVMKCMYNFATRICRRYNDVRILWQREC